MTEESIISRRADRIYRAGPDVDNTGNDRGNRCSKIYAACTDQKNQPDTAYNERQQINENGYGNLFRHIDGADFERHNAVCVYDRDKVFAQKGKDNLPT